MMDEYIIKIKGKNVYLMADPNGKGSNAAIQGNGI